MQKEFIDHMPRGEMPVLRDCLVSAKYEYMFENILISF